MNRALLQALNAPLFLLMALVAVAIQSSLFHGTLGNLIQPDFLILGVVWCGLRRPLIEGSILTLLLGEIAEIHSSAPQGILMLNYVGVFLLTRLSLKLFVVRGRRSWVLLAFIGALFWKVVFLCTLYLLDLSENQWRHTLTYLLPNAVSTGLISWWAMPWLERFDFWTWKSERVRQAIEGDLLLSDDDEDWS
jgi:cell shape-determining protein MreD